MTRVYGPYSCQTYIVLAFVVLAYIVMDYIVMDYIVMAHIVMAYVVMAYIVLCARCFRHVHTVQPALLTGPDIYRYARIFIDMDGYLSICG